MSAVPTIAVVIACHNRVTQTLDCLAGLRAQRTRADWRLVLFDDGSTDGTADAVKRVWPDATILRGDSSAFWAGGMRAAFAKAVEGEADFYLWLNDDVVLLPDALGTLLATYAATAPTHGGLAIVGGAVAASSGHRATYAGVRRASRLNPLRFGFQAPAVDRPQPCAALNGNAVLISHGTARRVGPIGAAYRQTLADQDYSLRVGRAGGWVGLAPGIVGLCSPNGVKWRWFNPALPLRERWAVVAHPLGFPPRPWLDFARQHGGPFWPLFALAPYWRLFVPPSLALRLRRTPESREVAHGA